MSRSRRRLTMTLPARPWVAAMACARRPENARSSSPRQTPHCTNSRAVVDETSALARASSTALFRSPSQCPTVQQAPCGSISTSRLGASSTATGQASPPDTKVGDAKKMPGPPLATPSKNSFGVEPTGKLERRRAAATQARCCSLQYNRYAASPRPRSCCSSETAADSTPFPIIWVENRKCQRRDSFAALGHEGHWRHHQHPWSC